MTIDENNAEITSYDIVPYFSHPFPQTHPNHLSVVARLFGVQTGDIKKCRVLEMGCSDGANLIPMAVQYADSEFVGVDLSKREVEQGDKTIQALKLKNIKIHCKNILEIDKSLGKFDYIIAHGIYSWVPMEVRKKMLQICREQLTPNGIAYMSYNCYPGWHMRGMLRDMMRYHVRQFKEVKQKVQQARALVNFLATSTPVENNPYGMLLKSELTQMQRWPDYYFYHDSLEETNDPVYFHQFIEAAMQSDLQYLGEADFSTMILQNFPQNVKDILQKIAPNIVSMEQYMDFVRNRMFRQTLICHKEIKLSRNVNADVLQDFYFSAPVRAIAAKPEIESNKMEKFQLANGREFSLNDPLAKAIWQHLAMTYPQTSSLKDLMVSIKQQIKIPEDNHKFIMNVLLQGYIKGIVQCYVHPYEITDKVSQYPLTAPLTRYQAQQQTWVTNQRHEAINIDVLRQKILINLDGKHDKKALLKLLHEMIDKGEISVAQQNKTIIDKEKAKNIVSEQMDMLLLQLAKMGLLIG